MRLRISGASAAMNWAGAGSFRNASSPRSRPRSAGLTNSVWLIGMPPAICTQVLTEGRLNQQMLEFAQTAAAVERGGVGGETAQRGRIGGQPSEPVSGMLVMLEQFRRRPAVRHQARRKGATRLVTEAVHQGRSL